MNIELLLEKAKALPKSPGVYFFLDKKGKVIYLGKSNKLRVRVLSHFRYTQVDMDYVDDIDYIETESNDKAITLESALLSRYKPKYNNFNGNNMYQSLIVFDSCPTSYKVIMMLRALGYDIMSEFIRDAIEEKWSRDGNKIKRKYYEKEFEEMGETREEIKKQYKWSLEGL